MPANLTPQYLKAEEAYRRATTLEEKIAALEDMLALIPKHKGTEKLQAEIKRKLAECRKAREQQRKKKGRRRDPFYVEPSGAGQVTLLGTPNSGKTSLVNALCGTHLKVAEYPFTTQLPAPGMAPYKDISIQLVDLPPVTEEVVPPGLVGALRQSDVVAIVLDLGEENLLEQLEATEGLLKNRGIIPMTKGKVELKDLELEIGFPKSALIVANKLDLDQGNLEVLKELYEGGLEILPVSAKEKTHLDLLLEKLFSLLDVIRVYSKRPGQKPDLDEPFVLPKGATIGDLAEEIHRDLPKVMKFARVWGPSAKFPGQQLQKDHVLQDGDIVEIHD